MANKTVQLTNDDGDNLYPLAGGMAADSITTAMLQDDAVTGAKIADGAVTSQNIDWTTMPFKRITAGSATISDTGSGAWHYAYVDVSSIGFTSVPKCVAGFKTTGSVPQAVSYISNQSSASQLVFGAWANSTAIQFDYIAIEL